MTGLDWDLDSLLQSCIAFALHLHLHFKCQFTRLPKPHPSYIPNPSFLYSTFGILGDSMEGLVGVGNFFLELYMGRVGHGKGMHVLEVHRSFLVFGGLIAKFAGCGLPRTEQLGPIRYGRKRLM
jgi:hypothetical protein